MRKEPQQPAQDPDDGDPGPIETVWVEKGGGRPDGEDPGPIEPPEERRGDGGDR